MKRAHQTWSQPVGLVPIQRLASMTRSEELAAGLVEFVLSFVATKILLVFAAVALPVLAAGVAARVVATTVFVLLIFAAGDLSAFVVARLSVVVPGALSVFAAVALPAG